MNIRKLCLISFFFATGWPAFAQVINTTNFEITFAQDPANPNLGFYDTTQLANLNLSAARINFHSARPDLGAIRRWIVSEVFEYIENTIYIHYTDTIKVNIAGYGSFPGSDALGFAYNYEYDDDPSVNRFINTIPQEKILTGIDPNGSAPDFSVFINFERFDADFGSDYEIGVPPGGFDLYTVLLHEVSHALGITSYISETGVSDHSGDYTKYDSLVQNQNGPAINPTTSPTFNSAVSLTDNDLSLNLPYGLQLGCYSPTIFKSGSSISHIWIYHNDSTLNSYSGHVMVASIGPNFRMSEWSRYERTILCAIGYTIRGSETMSPYGCNPFPEGRVDDEPHNSTQLICYDVLGNDYNSNGNSLVLDENFGEGGILVHSDLDRIEVLEVNDNKICFKPGERFCGTLLIEYRPMDSLTRAIGSSTFLTITRSCDFDPDFPCSFIANGGFERSADEAFLASQGDNNHLYTDDGGCTGSFVDNWWGYSADIARRTGIPGTPKFELNIGMGAPETFDNNVNNQRYAATNMLNEYLRTELIRPLEDVDYTLRYNTYVTDHNAPLHTFDIFITDQMLPNNFPHCLKNDVTGFFTANGFRVNQNPILIDTMDFDSWQDGTIDYHPPFFGGVNPYYMFMIPDSATQSSSYQYWDQVTLIPERAYDLDVTIAESNGLVVDDIVEIRVQTTNRGDNDGVDVTSTVTLPSCLDFVTSTSGTLSQTALNLAPGAESINTIFAKVTCGNCTYQTITTDLNLVDNITNNSLPNSCAKEAVVYNDLRFGSLCSCSGPTERHIDINICGGLNSLTLDATEFLVPNQTVGSWIDGATGGSYGVSTPIFSTNSFAQGYVFSFEQYTPYPNGSGGGLTNGCLTDITHFHLVSNPVSQFTETIDRCKTTNDLELTDVFPESRGLNVTWLNNGTAITGTVLSQPLTNGVYTGTYVNDQGCKVAEFTLVLECYGDCIEEDNGLLMFQKRYLQDEVDLIPRSTMVFNETLFTVADVLDENKMVLTLHDLRGELLNSWVYEHPNQNLSLKDIWVGDEGIYVLGNLCNSDKQVIGSFVTQGFIARMDLDGTFDWFETKELGSSQYNAFAPTHDASGLDGFIITGGMNASFGFINNALLCGVDLQGHMSFHKELDFSIPCSNCRNNEEQTYGFDITEFGDNNNSTQYGVLVITRDEHHNSHVATQTDGYPSKFTYLVSDKFGNFNPPAHFWESATGQAAPNKISAHYNAAFGHTEFVITGRDEIHTKAALMIVDNTYNHFNRTWLYDGAYLFRDAKIHDNSIVLNDQFNTHGYNQWLELDLYGNVMGVTKFGYGNKSSTNPADQNFHMYHFRSNRGHLVSILSNGQGIGTDVRDGGIKLYFTNSAYTSSCMENADPIIRMDWTLNTVLVNPPNIIETLPVEKEDLLCQNEIPLEEVCCNNDTEIMEGTNGCTYYFDFDIEFGESGFSVTGLDNPEPNTTIKISNSNGVQEEIYEPGDFYEVIEGMNQNICITQTYADGCTYTFCKCVWFECPVTETDAVYLVTNAYYPETRSDFHYYIIPEYVNGVGTFYNSLVGDGTNVGWKTHTLLAGVPYIIEFYDVNDCLLKTTTLVFGSSSPLVIPAQEETAPSGGKGQESAGEEMALAITGNAQIQDLDFSLKPNPNKGAFSIVNSGELMVYDQIQIIASSGKLVLEEENISASHLYDLSKAAAGTYFIFIRQNGYTERLKMILQK